MKSYFLTVPKTRKTLGVVTMEDVLEELVGDISSMSTETDKVRAHGLRKIAVIGILISFGFSQAIAASPTWNTVSVPNGWQRRVWLSPVQLIRFRINARPVLAVKTIFYFKMP